MLEALVVINGAVAGGEPEPGDIVCVAPIGFPWTAAERTAGLVIEWEDAELEAWLFAQSMPNRHPPCLGYPYAVYEQPDGTFRDAIGREIVA